MKRLFIIALLLIPITITAAPEQYALTWDAYIDNADFTNKLVYGECKTGTDSITPYTVLSEFSTGVPPSIVATEFTWDYIAGETLQCRLWGTGVNSRGDTVISPRSEVVELSYPLTTIPAPTGISLGAVP